jgi:hypothetical protein
VCSGGVCGLTYNSRYVCWDCRFFGLSLPWAYRKL